MNNFPLLQNLQPSAHEVLEAGLALGALLLLPQEPHSAALEVRLCAVALGNVVLVPAPRPSRRHAVATCSLAFDFEFESIWDESGILAVASCGRRLALLLESGALVWVRVSDD